MINWLIQHNEKERIYRYEFWSVSPLRILIRERIYRYTIELMIFYGVLKFMGIILYFCEVRSDPT